MPSPAVIAAEMAVLVDDRYQGQGLGTELYRRLVAIARDEKLKTVVSTILAENREMRAICQKLGFDMEADLNDGTIRVTTSAWTRPSSADGAQPVSAPLPELNAASRVREMPPEEVNWPPA